MNIFAMVLDYYDDRQHDVLTKVAGSARRDAMGQAEFHELTPEAHAKLANDNFGIVFMTKRGGVARRFPLNDPGNAWVSSQYFQETHEKLAFPARVTAAFFIKRACDAYKVPVSAAVADHAALGDEKLAQVGNRFSERHPWAHVKEASLELMEKSASAAEFDAITAMPDAHFALVIKTDGEVIRKYAMPDASHVKAAAQYFDKYAMQFAPQHRHRFAHAVKARAAELHVKLGGEGLIEKWAGDGWNKHVNVHLEYRKSLLPHNDKARATLDKLAASLGESTPADMAKTLEVFDEATGLSRYYNKGLPDPYSSVLGKTASGWSADVDGTMLTESDLRKVGASTKLASYLGSSIAEQFKKNPVEIFESLPNPEKVLIKQISEGTA